MRSMLSMRLGLRVASGAVAGHIASSKSTLWTESSVRRSFACETKASSGAQGQSLKQFLTSSKAQKWVRLNADKSEDCLVNTDENDWIQTAAGGVKRKLIERLGGEVARASTVVQFQPNACFPTHAHEGGEEFIVLEGAWHDDWATQPQYTYVRNYIGSRHTPRIGPNGATILVKLCQMSSEYKEPDHTQWDISPQNPNWRACESIPGRMVLGIFKSPLEEVRFERWKPRVAGAVAIPGDGEEVFVMEGSFEDAMGDHRKWSWCRSTGAVAERFRLSGDHGCLLYVKSKHLNSPEVDIHALQP